MNETDSLGFGPHVFIVSVQTAPVPLHTREGYSIWNTHSVTFDPLSTVTHTHTHHEAGPVTPAGTRARDHRARARAGEVSQREKDFLLIKVSLMKLAPLRR